MKKRPLYQEIVDSILQQIRDGSLQPGARVPSQNELAAMFGVNAITSRRALLELEEQGVVRRIRGKGTFVTAHAGVLDRKGHIAFVLQHRPDTNNQLYNPYITAALRGSAQTAAAEGYEVTFYTVPAGEDFSEIGHFDAWLLAGTLHRPSVESLFQKGKPVVTLTTYFPDLQVPVVGYDNVAGGFLAASHLIERGHKDIVIVCPPQDPKREFGSRLRGCQLALEQHGLPVGEDMIVYTDDTTEAAGFDAALKLFKQRIPGAVIAATDMIALGVLRAATKVNVHVPRDLSLVGYDDQAFAAHVVPALTTVRQNGYEVGALAFRVLKDKLEGRSPLQLRIEIPPSLVVRESTRAVAALEVASGRP